MNVIHKYTLPEAGKFEMEIPASHVKVLHVASQCDTPQLWLEVGLDGGLVRLAGYVCFTGETVPPGHFHVGTALSAGGSIVHHVYLKD
jgi:hypothetical protein